MKKLLLILPVLLVFGLALPVIAANNGGMGIQNGQQIQQQVHASSSPTGNQVQNRGEDTQLNNQEEGQENGLGEGLQTRSQTAIQNMSEVAKQVQLLLQTRTTGGIGEQVRQIAREQNQAQTQIEEQLNKLESKGKLARFLTGTDYKALKNLKQQLNENQLRIEQLTKLQTQLSNQSDITMVQATIEALIQENISLQERIAAEEQTRSMFGWLFKLFS
jgi:hypothetical protein